jgi:hypothetical protein
MIKIPKEESDNLVLSVLSEIAKNNDKDFSEQSFNLMDNEHDSAIFTGIILSIAKPSLFSETEECLQESIITIINSFFQTAIDLKTDLREDGFSELLIKTYENSNKYPNGFLENAKMKFAIVNLVGSFLQYERFEKKYPAVMKNF